MTVLPCSMSESICLLCQQTSNHRCKGCQKVLPPTAFRINQNGAINAHTCKECLKSPRSSWTPERLADRRAKDKLYNSLSKTKNRHTAYTRQRKQKIDDLKDQPCHDCGNRYPPECMDFDHVRGDKLFGVSTRRNDSWKRILAEMAKCDLVCANCHRIRTRDRLRAEIS